MSNRGGFGTDQKISREEMREFLGTFFEGGGTKTPEGGLTSVTMGDEDLEGYNEVLDNLFTKMGASNEVGRYYSNMHQCGNDRR